MESVPIQIIKLGFCAMRNICHGTACRNATLFQNALYAIFVINNRENLH